MKAIKAERNRSEFQFTTERPGIFNVLMQTITGVSCIYSASLPYLFTQIRYVGNNT